MHPNYRIYYTKTYDYYFLQEFKDGEWKTLCHLDRDTSESMGFVSNFPNITRVKFQTQEEATDFMWLLYESSPPEELELVKGV